MYDRLDSDGGAAEQTATATKTKGGRIHRFVVAHPLIVPLFFALYIVYMFIGNTVEHLRRQHVDRRDMAAQIGLSKRHYEEGDYDKAITLSQELNTGKGNHWYAEMTAGNAYFKKKDFEKALVHFQQATSLNTNMPLPYLNLALTYYRLGQIEEARTTYTHVIKHFGDEYPDMKKRAVDALYLIPQPAATPVSVF